jgi:3-hydroxyacyl-CoA dehydrogenase
VGAGLIGAGWAAYFLAQGLEVWACDPSPAAPERLAAAVQGVWPLMRRAGLVRVQGDAPAVHFAELDAVCGQAQFILENGPEEIGAKRALMARIDAAAPPGVVIASSSSSLMPSHYQQDAAQPGRILAAHPFNPPSLVPLVEIAGGALTDEDAVDWTLDFFRHVGKRPIHVKREQPGLVANRMTAALFREAVDLVASGVASVADIDAAICNGPGLRWAVMGPHLLYHLGGGAGGYRSYLDHLGPSQEARWASLRTTALTPEVRDRLVEGVDAELQALDLTDPEQFRDAAMADILAALAALQPRDR